MIGVDLIKIKRFKTIDRDNFKFWDKVFTEEEWLYCFNKFDYSQSLAGIFAAKEAVSKALGLNSQKYLSKINILHDKFGRPIVDIENNKKIKISVSISHESEYVVAVAIASNK